MLSQVTHHSAILPLATPPRFRLVLAKKHKATLTVYYRGIDLAPGC